MTERIFALVAAFFIVSANVEVCYRLYAYGWPPHPLALGIAIGFIFPLSALLFGACFCVIFDRCQKWE